MKEKFREGIVEYISSRYPNFYPEGSPMDYYTGSEAKRAIEYA